MTAYWADPVNIFIGFGWAGWRDQLLHWSGGPGLICFPQCAAYVWSPAGPYCKRVINLGLGKRRPICCSRLTMTSAVRPEEGDRFMTCSSEAKVQPPGCTLWIPKSCTWKSSFKEVTGDPHKKKVFKLLWISRLLVLQVKQELFRPFEVVLLKLYEQLTS